MGLLTSTGLSLTGLACGPNLELRKEADLLPRRTGKFTLKVKNPLGETEITWPLGWRRPETGIYILHIEPGALSRGLPYYADNNPPSHVTKVDFRIVTFIDVWKDPIELRGLLGRDILLPPEEDSWRLPVKEIDFSKPHILATSWRNWEFQEVIWDGKLLRLKNSGGPVV